MTKRNMLLVSLFLVFGLATMATSALASNIQWVTGSEASYSGRAEGLAEETGTYTLTQNVGGTIAANNFFIVQYNQTIVPGSQYIVCTGVDWGTAPSCAPELTATLNTPTSVKIIFNNPVTFTTVSDTIAVTVRINATLPAVGCTTTASSNPSSGPGVVTAFATAHGAGPGGEQVSITGTNANNTYPVLYVNCTPNLSLGFAPKDKKVDYANGLAGQVLNCIGTKDLGPYDNSFCVNIDEEFVNALTSYSFEYASDPDATNGTTVIITLYDVPATMKVKVEGITTCGKFDHHDPDQCAGYWNSTTMTWVPSSPPPSLTLTAGKLTCTADAGSSPPTQTCTVTLTVDTEDNGVYPENFDVCFTYKNHGPLPVGYNEMWLDIQKGPLAPPTGMLIPEFNGSSELPLDGLSVVDFTDCQTVLLYPYVTSAGVYGYDTGIAVANTTMDPFDDLPFIPPGFPSLAPTYGKGTAIPQTGDCYFYIYSGGTLTAWYNTGPIIPGSVDAFFLSSVAPGVLGGYAIAVCEFLDAHGFGVIYSNAGLYIGFAYDYLAFIFPDPAFYTRQKNLLGEGAITQYYLNDFFKYLLIYDPPKHH